MVVPVIETHRASASRAHRRRREKVAHLLAAATRTVNLVAPRAAAYPRPADLRRSPSAGRHDRRGSPDADEGCAGRQRHRVRLARRSRGDVDAALAIARRTEAASPRHASTVHDSPRCLRRVKSRGWGASSGPRRVEEFTSALDEHPLDPAHYPIDGARDHPFRADHAQPLRSPALLRAREDHAARSTTASCAPPDASIRDACSCSIVGLRSATDGDCAARRGKKMDFIYALGASPRSSTTAAIQFSHAGRSKSAPRRCA